jgi:signal transduction histidine kinase
MTDKTEVTRPPPIANETAAPATPRILLVDDQPARLLTYESILHGVGVECVRSLSGKHALAQLLNDRFALILLDVSMPDMDGFETARTGRMEGAFLCLCVKDSGVGIAPELIPRLFNMFSQLEGTRDRSEGGLGIGLALAKNIVELHGGTVAAKSAGQGAGSEFQIRLPVLESSPV